MAVEEDKIVSRGENRMVVSSVPVAEVSVIVEMSVVSFIGSW